MHVSFGDSFIFTGERTTLSEERGRLTATPQTQNPVPPTSTTSVITQLAVQESDAPPDYEDVLNNDTAGTTLKPSNDVIPCFTCIIALSVHFGPEDNFLLVLNL